MPKTMLALKAAAHIHTARQIRSFRSGGISTGTPVEALGGGRIRFEYERLACRERRCRWIRSQSSQN